MQLKGGAREYYDFISWGIQDSTVCHMQFAGSVFNFNGILLSECTETSMVSISLEGILFNVDWLYFNFSWFNNGNSEAIGCYQTGRYSATRHIWVFAHYRG
jgi:hypothetical protein